VRFLPDYFYHMLTELQRRDITPLAAREKFLDGLETLAETFGGSEALSRTIAQMRQQEGDELIRSPLESDNAAIADAHPGRLKDGEGLG